MLVCSNVLSPASSENIGCTTEARNSRPNLKHNIKQVVLSSVKRVVVAIVTSKNQSLGAHSRKVIYTRVVSPDVMHVSHETWEGFDCAQRFFTNLASHSCLKTLRARFLK